MTTIRAIADVCTWQAVMAKKNAVGDFLPMANMAPVRLLERRGTAGLQPTFHMQISLPANMAGTLKKVWSSCGADLPLATVPLEEGDAAELLYYLTTEINRKLQVGLGTQISTTPLSSRNICENIMFFGNCHAEKLAIAAQSTGRRVELIKVPAIKEVEIRFAAIALREMLSSIPQAKRVNTLVVFAILDEKGYMTKTAECALVPI